MFCIAGLYYTERMPNSPIKSVGVIGAGAADMLDIQSPASHVKTSNISKVQRLQRF